MAWVHWEQGVSWYGSMVQIVSCREATKLVCFGGDHGEMLQSRPLKWACKYKMSLVVDNGGLRYKAGLGCALCMAIGDVREWALCHCGE